ncbi:MAG: 3D domain-containing protein [Phycisphaerales bacterium]
MVQKTEDMIVRQRRVVGDAAPQPFRGFQLDGAGPRRHWSRRFTTNGLWLIGLVGTVTTAIMAKELGPVQPLAALDTQASVEPVSIEPVSVATPEVTEVAAEADPVAALEAALTQAAPADTTTRWFNGRPVRPARTITMRVTAYSPDAASCYPYADGQTATLHGVDTNGGFLVAADTDMLPFGSMLSIDGYAQDSIVPVLDRGGAIKGNKLDVLFPTHEAALQWGVRDIEVVVWEYADGKPADDPRKLRS